MRLISSMRFLTHVYGIVMMIEFIVCLFPHYLLSEHITIILGKRQSSRMDRMVLDTAQAGANSCNAVMRAVAQSLLRVT